MNKHILAIQIVNDLVDLLKDLDTGLYSFSDRYQNYLQARDKIMKKIWQYEELQYGELQERYGIKKDMASRKI